MFNSYRSYIRAIHTFLHIQIMVCSLCGCGWKWKIYIQAWNTHRQLRRGSARRPACILPYPLCGKVNLTATLKGSGDRIGKAFLVKSQFPAITVCHTLCKYSTQTNSSFRKRTCPPVRPRPLSLEHS